MKTVRSVRNMQALSMLVRREGKRIALVPTMGSFHEGHLSLMAYARKVSDFVVVSIFVNPLQFGPAEDLGRYPRDLKRDRAMAREAEVDVLFCPSAEDMYRPGFQTHVEVEEVTRPLCGRTRPGHFRGVTTVVAKLLNIVLPHKAIFGLKDYQQWLAIRRMAEDLNLGVTIIGRPTVRETDGLAMSSRNKYLSATERKNALALHRSMSLARDLVRKGENNTERIAKFVKDSILSQDDIEIEYVTLCHPQTLEEQATVGSGTLLAIAARIGKTRLIDNCLLSSENN